MSPFLQITFTGKFLLQRKEKTSPLILHSFSRVACFGHCTYKNKCTDLERFDENIVINSIKIISSPLLYTWTKQNKVFFFLFKFSRTHIDIFLIAFIVPKQFVYANFKNINKPNSNLLLCPARGSSSFTEICMCFCHYVHVCLANL